MTNENELKVGDIDLKNVIEWQKLTITSRDERIKLLESAIREFLYKPDTKNSLGANIYVETMRNLMENKS